MTAKPQNLSPSVRQRWRITGQVQGVGFRPFVYRLAVRHGLTGFVRNNRDGVYIEVQGPANNLAQFGTALREQAPSLAVIATATVEDVEPASASDAFVIHHSDGDVSPRADVTVDTAVCEDCRRELLDAADRRAGYGLINCTNCGPRFTIINRVPYDRPNTTMAGFDMCPACRAEYEGPADRRFHAQPIACHDCGPTVSLVDPHGSPVAGDPIATAAEMLRRGRILAIKGLGGFHLAVRGDDALAVERLRQLKQRDAKPFALMCRDIAAARRVVHLSDTAAAEMQSPACPIVLAPKRSNAPVAPAVAPDNHRLGVMLPYTPIQQLLFHGGAPDLLVMTSGNQSDEPIAIDNDEAVQRLGGLCDAMLWHDRPIRRCVDDSVVIDMGEAAVLPLRRARGYVPMAVALPTAVATTGLCVGGELKNTVAIVREGRAVISQHLGDLTHALAFGHFKQAITDLCDLYGVWPRWIAHDLHPLYLSGVHARQLAEVYHAPLIGVQHHHAHAASVMAEHGVTGPVLAVVCDGVGYGTDGSIWGGELLLADLLDFRRLAHLRAMRLPGGDAAARDTRRCALALLHQAYGDDFADHPAARRAIPDTDARAMLTRMIVGNVNCALSSGAGRVFDGVAALLGLASRNHFEAQAAIALEAAAWRHEPSDAAEKLFEIVDGDDGPRQLDLSLLVRRLVEGVDAGEPVGSLAALLHDALAAAWAAAVAEAVEKTHVRTVALSGGVFCNQRLTERLTELLESQDLRVLRHRQLPPNDGGISYGQAAIAAARAAKK